MNEPTPIFMYSSCVSYTNPGTEFIRTPILAQKMFHRSQDEKFVTNFIVPQLSRFTNGENLLFIGSGDPQAFIDSFTVTIDSAFKRAKQIPNVQLKFSMCEIQNDNINDLLTNGKLDHLSELFIFDQSPAVLLKNYNFHPQKHIFTSLKLQSAGDGFESRISGLFLNFHAFDSFLLQFIEYVQNVQLKKHFLTSNQFLLQNIDPMFDQLTSVCSILFVDITNVSNQNEANVSFFNEIHLLKDINARYISGQVLKEKTEQDTQKFVEYKLYIQKLKSKIQDLQDDMDSLRHLQIQIPDQYEENEQTKLIVKLLQDGNSAQQIIDVINIEETRQPLPPLQKLEINQKSLVLAFGPLQKIQISSIQNLQKFQQEMSASGSTRYVQKSQNSFQHEFQLSTSQNEKVDFAKLQKKIVDKFAQMNKRGGKKIPGDIFVNGELKKVNVAVKMEVDIQQSLEDFLVKNNLDLQEGVPKFVERYFRFVLDTDHLLYKNLAVEEIFDDVIERKTEKMFNKAGYQHSQIIQIKHKEGECMIASQLRNEIDEMWNFYTSMKQ